eukprot:TRINITY_DN940_c0_g1_i2.p1 TRINITY_DN940_c0_g1~~TRINITY_DN940_c0_g1_i2.p1  ORF type:complete len:489 (+),score=92.01 TRINITY_DN940_c0_g1_i2:34-1500(+)
MFVTARIITAETFLCYALYAVTLLGKGVGNVPLRPMLLLALCLTAAQSAIARNSNARAASSGLVVCGSLIPLAFLGQPDYQNTGFLISWLVAVFVSAQHVGMGSKSLKASSLTAVVALLGLLRPPAPAFYVIPFASIGCLMYITLISAIPRSLTEGETLICAQLWALLCYAIFGFGVGTVYLTKLRIAMVFGVVGAVCVGGSMLALKARSVRNPAVYYFALLCGAAAVLLVMSLALDQNSLVWLYMYVFEKKAVPFSFIQYYCAVLMVGLPFAPRNFFRKNRTIARKYFHLLAIIMFVPTILLHVRFLALAFSVAFAIFIVVECLRVAKVEPLASTVDEMFGVYIDEKDEGTAVLTHMYLLIGCALPVWYVFVCHHGGVFSAKSLLCAIGGVTVTGLGDACASVMGVLFGRHKWGSSRKTIEGSLAMILSIIAFQYWALWFNGFHNLSGASWCKLILADLGVVLLEAVTDQVDNLILPLCHVVTLQLI